MVTTTTMQQCQELIDKVREFRYLKNMEGQMNKFIKLLQKQEGNITYTGNPPNPQPGRSTSSTQSTPSGQSPSPSNGAPAARALGNSWAVANSTWDQGGRP